LISTDVLSEGLNLQDATRLINYDLHGTGAADAAHWAGGPALDPEMSQDCGRPPGSTPLRGKVVYWNFLPPERNWTSCCGSTTGYRQDATHLEGVRHRVGKSCSRPKRLQALRDFTHHYQGTLTPPGADAPGIAETAGGAPRIAATAGRVAGAGVQRQGNTQSGRAGGVLLLRLAGGGQGAGRKGRKAEAEGRRGGGNRWRCHRLDDGGGSAAWYLYDLATGKILEQPEEMVDFVRSQPDTPRRCVLTEATLRAARLKVEKHIKNTYLKRVQRRWG
jgi:hypothetical protein